MRIVAAPASRASSAVASLSEWNAPEGRCRDGRAGLFATDFLVDFPVLGLAFAGAVNCCFALGTVPKRLSGTLLLVTGIALASICSISSVSLSTTLDHCTHRHGSAATIGRGRVDGD